MTANVYPVPMNDCAKLTEKARSSKTGHCSLITNNFSSFSYDSMNRRVGKDVSIFSGNTAELSSRTRFLYDGWNLIAEWSADLQSASLSKIHLWGLDLSGSLQGAGGVGGLLSTTLVSNSSSYYPTYDGNGNITAWLDGSGAMLDKRDYDPFGALLTQYKLTATPAILDELPFGFSTKYTDKESGLLYYGHRYYNTRNKRWLNRDLIEEAGGVNLYGYVGNDGVSDFDVRGLKSGKDIVNGVIKVMQAKGWTTAYALASLWWSLPANDDPKKKYNDTIVKMNWALGYAQAKKMYTDLTTALYKSDNAKRLLVRRLQTAGVWDSGGSFGYLYFDAKDFEANGPDGEMYVNSVKYDDKPPLNDLGAALGKFQMRIGLGGCLEIKGSERLFHLREKYTYIVDSYDFNDARVGLNPTTWIDQQLGYWNFTSNDVMNEIPFGGGAYYTRVDNGDFRAARKEMGKGGDFTIYSDVKTDQAFEIIDLP